MKKLLSKLTSVKTLVTLWAVIMISFIVFSNKTDFMIIAQILCAVPLAYLGVNVWQKNILNKNGGDENGEN